MSPCLLHGIRTLGSCQDGLKTLALGITEIRTKRYVWLRCTGVLHLWNPTFFTNLACTWGKIIKTDDNTSGRKRFDVTHILVSTLFPSVIVKTILIKTIEEEIASDSSTIWNISHDNSYCRDYVLSMISTNRAFKVLHALKMLMRLRRHFVSGGFSNSASKIVCGEKQGTVVEETRNATRGIRRVVNSNGNSRPNCCRSLEQ
ncbi:hypothetical protein Ancab_012372, partial [Ancistrocladus abbreviatus]